MTTQDMIDEAMEEGAAHFFLWYVGACQSFVKVTDNGFWYYCDDKEHLISQDDARRLIDCYTIGYVD